MKRILSKIALGCMITAGLTACTDWLDVNTDPDNPNNKSLLVSNRLSLDTAYVHVFGGHDQTSVPLLRPDGYTATAGR